MLYENIEVELISVARKKKKGKGRGGINNGKFHCLDKEKIEGK